MTEQVSAEESKFTCPKCGKGSRTKPDAVLHHCPADYYPRNYRYERGRA